MVAMIAAQASAATAEDPLTANPDRRCLSGEEELERRCGVVSVVFNTATRAGLGIVQQEKPVRADAGEAKEKAAPGRSDQSVMRRVADYIAAEGVSDVLWAWGLLRRG